jgi:hypothetical protein
MATVNDLVTIGAPLLASVLGGPPALTVGVMSLVTKALDLPSNASVEDVTKEVKAKPEMAEKLQEIEASYPQYLLSVRLQMDQAEYADRANARAREVDMAKAMGVRDWYPPVLGTIVIMAFTVVLCTMIFLPPKQNRDQGTMSLVNILVGALTAGYSTVLGYYFGSSAGSRTKDFTIAKFNSELSGTSPVPIEPAPLPLPVDSAPSPQSISPSSQRQSWRDL